MKPQTSLVVLKQKETARKSIQLAVTFTENRDTEEVAGAMDNDLSCFVAEVFESHRLSYVQKHLSYIRRSPLLPARTFWEIKLPKTTYPKPNHSTSSSIFGNKSHSLEEFKNDNPDYRRFEDNQMIEFLDVTALNKSTGSDYIGNINEELLKILTKSLKLI